MAALETGSQSIDRAARILVRLVESDDVVTLASVIEETRLPKTTAARLLRALERNGLAQRRPGGGFRPGPVLVDYARRDSAVGDLATLALPVPRAPRADHGRDDERRHPDADGRRAAGPGRQPPSARRGQLGRAPHPDPHVLDGEGLHGVRRRPAAVRTAGAARPEHDHQHSRPARTSSSRSGGTATRRRGRSSRPASAPRPRRSAAPAAPCSPRSPSPHQPFAPLESASASWPSRWSRPPLRSRTTFVTTSRKERQSHDS